MQKGGTWNVEILNSTGSTVTIPKGTVIAKYVQIQEEEYCEDGIGICSDLHDTDQTTHTEEQANNMNIETDTSDQTSATKEDNVVRTKELDVQHIPKATEIKDFTPEELERLFSQAPLKEIGDNLKKSNMHIPGEPTDEQLNKLKQLIAKRASIWTKDEKNPQKIKNYSVFIEPHGAPIVERIRPYTAEEAKIWKEHVEQLLKYKTVEYSNSPWRSASFLVKKPNGGFRFVTDYRKANAQVEKLHWPLVRVDAAISALGNSNVISSFDAN
jgi:hypothetical protein